MKKLLLRDYRDDPAKGNCFGSLIGKSRLMKGVYEEIIDYSRVREPVLITGSTGTGKELVAREIHEMYVDDGERPFIPVNCAAIPETLLESELFGHVRGAFTGAVGSKKGKFELADEGTLFLDEVAEMPASTQAKLHRAIQWGEIYPVGSERITPIYTTARIIAATNQNLPDRISSGDFRFDLYTRLNVCDIHLPDLDRRHGDKKILAIHFLRKYNDKYQKGIHLVDITDEALDMIDDLGFPGNVRQLETFIYKVSARERTGEITGERIKRYHKTLSLGIHPQEPDGMPSPDNLGILSFGPNIKDIEKAAILEALDKTGGNRTHAAEMLGMSVRKLRNKLKEYDQQ